MRDIRAVDPLLLKLKDNNEHFVCLTALSLQKIGDPRAKKPLINLLKSGFVSMEVNLVIDAIISFSGSYAQNELLSLVECLEDDLMRLACALSLSNIADETIVE